MIRTRIIASVILGGCVGVAGSAFAQSPAMPGRVEIGFGALWMGQAKLASGDALETTSTGGDFRLFSTSTTLSDTVGYEARVGIKLANHLELVGAGSHGTPRLRVDISNDVEGAASITASERIQQFTVTGGALWYPMVRRFSPFLEVEAGWLRGLHENRSLVSTGRVYVVGGGFKYRLIGGSGLIKSMGARVDARAVARSKGVVFDELRVSPALAVGIYTRF